MQKPPDPAEPDDKPPAARPRKRRRHMPKPPPNAAQPDAAPTRKLADHLAYPPRGMRLERAAAYVGLSPSKFLEKVDEGIMPKPIRWDGCVVWDRLKLDAVFEGESNEGRQNTIHRLLGISGGKT
jgi:hypothetical protein